ncbi:MAG: NUDIX hydrolase [Anaerolineae bacterium]|nr:NUDIX hydrolase [Anaerolineae bacterium]
MSICKKQLTSIWMTDLSRVVVIALVFIQQGDTILLVKQDYGPQYWSLPGGVMEPGESIGQTAIREVKEETGLDVRLRRVVGLYSKPSEEALAVCFEGEVIGGTLQADNEISECRYFPYGCLPEVAREHLPQRIEDFRGEFPHAVVRTQ